MPEVSRGFSLVRDVLDGSPWRSRCLENFEVTTVRRMPINADVVPLIAAFLAVETKRSVFFLLEKLLPARLKQHLSGDRRWSFFLSEPFPVAASVSCFLLLGTCGGTLDSLSCAILLLTTECKICLVRFDEKITLGVALPSITSFRSDELVLRLSRQHVHHQPLQRSITSRNFYAVCQCARRFWRELTFLLCSGPPFSSCP